MPFSLQNNAFQIAIHPELSTWDVLSQTNPRIHLQNIRMSLHYRTGLGHAWALENWDHCQASPPETVSTPHGRAHQITLNIAPDRRQLEYRIVFALPDQQPFLMWKVQIMNTSRNPVYLGQIELLNLGFINVSHGLHGFSLRHSISLSQGSNKGTIHLGGNKATKHKNSFTDLGFFSNGWQSWSYTGLYQAKDKYQTTRLGPFRSAMIENASTGHPRHANLYNSDMFGVLGDRLTRAGFLVGFLSQKNHFGSLQAYLDPFHPALRMWASGDGAKLEPDEMTETDWACIFPIQIDTPDSLSPYFEAVAREHSLYQSMPFSSPSGWCSWYYFSSTSLIGTVTHQAIIENTKSAAELRPELPLEVIQIDDGFEQNIGDWFAFQPTFPEGLAPLSTEIRQSGFTPGLWLAPFIVHPKSDLYKQHPDWLLKNKYHRLVNAGYCWNAFTTALDLTHPDALDYCKQVIHRAVHEWGYPYIKLDFLYAAALPGKFQDPHKTRAQVLRKGLESLRSAVGPGTHLLGCGCPLGPSIGLVDSMRIGTDTARGWYPSFQGIKTYFDRDTSMPSAFYSIHNTLTRAPMHRRWWINDPDCLLVRPDSNLSLEEVKTVASAIALTGGSLFLSDDLPKLPPERLRIAQALLPLIDKRPYILDWFDEPTPSLVQLDLDGAPGEWSLLGVFNWQDVKVDKTLSLTQTYLDPENKYLAREFWTGEIFQIVNGQLTLNNIPAHGIRLLAIRPLQTFQPIYLGSDLHISQGLEVSEWTINNTEVFFRINRPGKALGFVDFFLPKSPKLFSNGTDELPFTLFSQNVYRINVNINESTFFTLKW